MMAKENVYLASKPRYEILDGLRGVAALMVIIFHCFETYIPILDREALPLARRACRIVPAGLGESVGDYAALAVAGEALGLAEVGLEGGNGR